MRGALVASTGVVFLAACGPAVTCTPTTTQPPNDEPRQVFVVGGTVFLTFDACATCRPPTTSQVVYSRDAGATWSVASLPSGFAVATGVGASSLWGQSGDLFLAAGDANAMQWRATPPLHSSDGGATWLPTEFPPADAGGVLADGTLILLSSSDAPGLYKGRASGIIHTSRDSGATWAARSTPFPPTSVAAALDGTIYVAGAIGNPVAAIWPTPGIDSDSFLWVSTDGARSFIDRSLPFDGGNCSGEQCLASTAPGRPYDSLVRVAPDGVVYVGPTEFYRSSDRGEHWIALSTPRFGNSPDFPDDLWILPAGELFAAAGPMLRSSDRGDSWTQFDCKADSKDFFYAIAGDATGAFAVTQGDSGSKLWHLTIQ